MLDFQKATEAIKHHENILILPSSPVDGDSIGSALAIYSLLQGLGKNATVVLTSEIPDIYRFMPNIDAVQKTAKLYSDFMITIDLKNQQLENIKHEIVDNKVNIIVTPEKGSFASDQVSFPEPKKYFDLLITVDCADLTQLGSFYKQNYSVFSDIPSINIDHHVSNKNYGSLNLVDTDVSSTTQLLFNWFKNMNAQIDEDIATLLLAGIITDTGSFQNANTTPQSFDAAAELIDLGGRQQEIIRHIYKTKQLNSLKLWGKILSKIQVNETYRYLWSSATQSDFKQTGTNSSDKGDIIDELMSNAQEADVILLLEEKSDGSLHGSLRSTSEDINISPIAEKYNGGGHAMASGFTIPNATVDTHQNQILQTIEEFQKNRLQPNTQQTQKTSELTSSPEQPEPSAPTPTSSPSPIFEKPSQPDTPEPANNVEAQPTEPTNPPQESTYDVDMPDQPEKQPIDSSKTSELSSVPTQTEQVSDNTNNDTDSNSLDNLPSVDDIIIGDSDSNQENNEFSTEKVSDPNQDFDPLDLQDELNNFNKTFSSDPLQNDESQEAKSNEQTTDPDTEKDIEKLTRDFVSKEDQQDNSSQS